MHLVVSTCGWWCIAHHSLLLIHGIMHVGLLLHSLPLLLCYSRLLFSSLQLQTQGKHCMVVCKQVAIWINLNHPEGRYLINTHPFFDMISYQHSDVAAISAPIYSDLSHILNMYFQICDWLPTGKASSPEMDWVEKSIQRFNMQKKFMNGIKKVTTRPPKGTGRDCLRLMPNI